MQVVDGSTPATIHPPTGSPCHRVEESTARYLKADICGQFEETGIRTQSKRNNEVKPVGYRSYDHGDGR